MPLSSVVVSISPPELQIYRARLNITTKLGGVAYAIYKWKMSFGFIVITAAASAQIALVVLAKIIIVRAQRAKRKGY